ncbi:MAG: hypothetical protein EA403_07390 [Spirochaetaceae bacterium]|nr:MAG: hypothetical protein EA403_07390 [Spirochaetaceae bacterium]
MHIVYYCAAVTGSGHTVRGVAIHNALVRTGVPCEFTMVGTMGMPELARGRGIAVVELEHETFETLDPDRYRESVTFRTLLELNPDILIVDLAWFATHRLVADLRATTVLLVRQVSKDFFSYEYDGTAVYFDPTAFDRVIRIEPCDLPFHAQTINPIVIRNPSEIFSRADAASTLGLDPARPTALIATNGKLGEYEELIQTYSYLDDEFQLIRTSNHHGGIFPIVDFFNAVDLVVCSGGYNAFWEALFFGKDAVFVPHARRFESQAQRINRCQDYRFTGNGADQLVGMLVG